VYAHSITSCHSPSIERCCSICLDTNMTGSKRFEFSATAHGWAVLFLCSLVGIAFPSIQTSFALGLALVGILVLSFGYPVAALLY